MKTSTMSTLPARGMSPLVVYMYLHSHPGSANINSNAAAVIAAVQIWLSQTAYPPETSRYVLMRARVHVCT